MSVCLRVGWFGKKRRFALGLVPVLAVVLMATSNGSASVGRQLAPLDYHATVVNGRVTGSSFMISDGVVATNAHVLNGKRRGERVELQVPGRRRASAEILAVSDRIDLALLRVDRKFLPVAPNGAARAGPGSALVAAGVVAGSRGPGNRMEIAGRSASRLRNLAPYGPGIIVQMPGIRRGFSGGPVFDSEGQLVGMVAALRPAPGSSQTGQEAYVLSADAVRAETRRLLRRL